MLSPIRKKIQVILICEKFEDGHGLILPFFRFFLSSEQVDLRDLDFELENNLKWYGIIIL